MRFILGALFMSIFSAIGYADEKGIFELQCFSFNPGKSSQYEELVETSGLAAVKKFGANLVGAWKPTDTSDERLFLLFHHEGDEEAATKIWNSVKTDPDWKKASEDFQVKNGNAVKAFQRVFLSELDFGSNLQGQQEGSHIFELRTYVTTTGNLPKLHNRFRNHTVPLFEKHGMKNLVYWSIPKSNSASINQLASTFAKKGVELPDFSAIGSAHENLLVYLLEHETEATAKSSFSSFMADPVWKVALADSERDAKGSLTAPKGVLSLYLKACDFSPLK